MTEWAPIVAALVSFLLTSIAAIFSWASRAEARAAKAQIELLRLQIELLGTKTELMMSKAENRFFERINGSYVKKEVFDKAVEDLKVRVDNIDG